MSWNRRLFYGLRSLGRRDAEYQEYAEEVQHFFDQAVADQMDRGLSRSEAERLVRLELGSVDSSTEQVHTWGWENVVDALRTDLRYALRGLLADGSFTVPALLTLAVGIGVTTTIFSAVNAVLLRPLPLPQADRVVSVWDIGSDGSKVEQTFGTYVELKDRVSSFESLAVMKPWQPTSNGSRTPQRLQGQSVSAGYFSSLGVLPSQGRNFRSQDDRQGGPAEVILSHDLWQRHFAGDPRIVDRPIMLDDRPYSVIGVMPPSFENAPQPTAELWTLLQYDLSQGRAWGHHLQTVGRLKAGVDLESAVLELSRVAANPVDDHPRPSWASMENGLKVSRLQDEITEDIQPALLALFGAAILVLAIATVNVVGLLLARGAKRRGELALRAALGAGHRRLVRQMLTESLLLAILGGSAGLAVAAVACRVLPALSPADVPRIQSMSLDGPVALFAFTLTLVVGLLFGLLPALRASREDPHRSMRFTSQRSLRGADRTRNFLVIAEVALAVVLLIGSGLLLRSLQQLMAVDVGFEGRGVLSLQVRVSGPDYRDRIANENFFAQALEKIRSIPGVASAAYSSQLPLDGNADAYGAFFEHVNDIEPNQEQGAFRYTVSPGYFETLAIPVLSGRGLTSGDRRDGRKVVVISQSLAERRLPGVDPIGRRLKVGPDEEAPYTVVGVVKDVRQRSLALADAEAFYTTSDQWHFADSVRKIVVRSDGVDPEQLVTAVRQAIWSVDSGRPISHVATLGDLIDSSLAERRFALYLFEIFAFASLLLSAAGIYGLLSGNVALRTRELGVRSALGASRHSLWMLVLRQGWRLAGWGVALGVPLAYLAGQGISALVYGVSRLDPKTYLGVVVLVTTVCTVACAAPAWRASSTDPASVLRSE